MRVVRFVDDIGDRQLMRPHPPGLFARREGVATPEVEKNVRGLPDQHFAVFQERRGEGRMRSDGSIHQPLHRRDAAGVARDVDVFGAGFLQREAHEFTAPLDRRPVIELISHCRSFSRAGPIPSRERPERASRVNRDLGRDGGWRLPDAMSR